MRTFAVQQSICKPFIQTTSVFLDPSWTPHVQSKQPLMLTNPSKDWIKQQSCFSFHWTTRLSAWTSLERINHWKTASNNNILTTPLEYSIYSGNCRTRPRPHGIVFLPNPSSSSTYLSCGCCWRASPGRFFAWIDSLSSPNEKQRFHSISCKCMWVLENASKITRKIVASCSNAVDINTCKSTYSVKRTNATVADSFWGENGLVRTSVYVRHWKLINFFFVIVTIASIKH